MSSCAECTQTRPILVGPIRNRVNVLFGFFQWCRRVISKPSKACFAVIPIAIIPGCSIPPPSTQMPPVSLPRSFSVESGTDGNASLERMCWRDFLPKELAIEPLIVRAIEHNRDVEIASARISEARALLRQRRAESGLTVQSNADATVNRTTSGATAAGALLEELFPEISDDIGLPSNATFPLFRSTLAVSGFELDLWGRLSNLNAAARSRVLATEWNRRAVQLALLREIVSLSLQRTESLEQQRATYQLLAVEKERLKILELRESEGLSAYADVLNQRERIVDVENALSRLSLNVSVLTYSLAFLSGENEWNVRDTPIGSRWTSRSTIHPGLPSQLLLVRPDIKAAESRLLAVRADVSAARARLFPSISLTGLFGFASSDLSSLFNADSMVFNGGGLIDLPIFDRPARLANIELTMAREREAVAEYQKAVGNGFREVNAALAARRWYSVSEEKLERQVGIINEQFEIAEQQEKAGLTSGLETMAVKLRLLEVVVRQVSNSARLAEANFGVFLSMGGGSGEMCGNLPQEGEGLGVKPPG